MDRLDTARELAPKDANPVLPRHPRRRRSAPRLDSAMMAGMAVLFEGPFFLHPDGRAGSVVAEARPDHPNGADTVVFDLVPGVAICSYSPATGSRAFAPRQPYLDWLMTPTSDRPWSLSSMVGQRIRCKSEACKERVLAERTARGKRLELGDLPLVANLVELVGPSPLFVVLTFPPGRQSRARRGPDFVRVEALPTEILCPHCGAVGKVFDGSPKGRLSSET